jgi:hypothetical protein
MAKTDKGTDTQRGGIEQKIEQRELHAEMLRGVSNVIIPLLLFIISLYILFTDTTTYVPAHNLFTSPVYISIFGCVFLFQVVQLFMAGQNDARWWLALIAGSMLTPLLLVYMLFGPIATTILVIICLLLLIVLFRHYFHSVAEGRVEILIAFGKYTRTLYPGANALLPWEHIKATISTKETIWTCTPQRIPVSSKDDASITASVSYQINPEEAYIVAMHIENWEESFHTIFEAATQTVVSTFTPADFETWNEYAEGKLIDREDANPSIVTTSWSHINNELGQSIRGQVNRWGVIVHWARIRDITITTRVTATIEAIDSPAYSKETIPATSPKSSNDILVIDNDILEKAYNAVRTGQITDPYTIKTLAAQFSAIAGNIEANAQISFDAERAAQSLYKRAKDIEE